MVLAKQTYRLTDTSDPNTIEDEINAAIAEQEKELQEAIDQAQEAVDKSDQITADLEETNNKIDNIKIEMDTNIGEINTNIGDINTNIGEVNDRVQSVTADLSNVKTNIEDLDTNIGTINTDIGGIRDNIGTINTDIHAINNRLKAPNLINNPEPMFELKDNPYSQNSQNESGWAKMDSRVNNKAIIPVNMQMFNATQGKKYTEQVEIETDGVLNNLTFSFYTQTNNTHNTVDATTKSIGPGKYIVYATWIANISSLVRTFSIKDISFTGTYIKFRHPKFEEGDYTPYYLDGNFTAEVIKRVEQTSDGLIAEVGNLQLNGNPNLIDRKEPMVQLNAYPSNHRTEVDGDYAKFSSIEQGQEILPVDAITLQVEANKKYTQQVKVRTDGTLSSLTFTFFIANRHHEVPATLEQKSDDTWLAYASYTPTGNGNLRCIDIKSFNIEGGTYVAFGYPKVEQGDYTAYNLSDSLDKVQNEYSRLEMTTNGIQTTVADNTGKIAQITQTVDGLNSTVKDFKYNENLLFSPDNFLDANHWRVEEGKQGVEVKKDCVSFDIQTSRTRSFYYDLNKIKKPLELTPKTYTLSWDMKLSEDYDMDTEKLQKQTFEIIVVKANGSLGFLGRFNYLVENKGVSKEKWIRLSQTGAIGIDSYTDPKIYFGAHNLYDGEVLGKVMIRNIKLEEGDVATGMESISQQVSQITQTVGGISHRVESIENMNNGNRNLLVDANNMKDATYWSLKGGDGKVTIREGIAELKQAWGGPAYSETQFKQDYQSELKIGQNYTYSLDVLVPNNTTLQSGTVLNFYSSIFTNGLKICDLNNLEKGKWQRVSVVTQYTGGDNLDLIRPEMNKTPSSGVVKLRRLKMEIGNKPTDYDSLSINFSEIQQQVDSIKQTVSSQDGKISSIEQTAQGIQQTVSDQNGKISQVTQTVEGMNSKVTDATNKVSEITQTVNGMQSTVNDNTGNISKLTQKVDGIKTEVQDNKNNISQVTQTAEALQQKVTDNENNITQVTQTSTAIQQQIEDVKGNINTITSTVEGTTQRIENVEGQITEINHTVDGVEQTVQNQNGQLSSMQQNIDGFTQRVEGMIGDVSGANLIGNKDPMIEMTATPSNVKSENHEGYAKFSTNLEGQQVAPSSAITVKEETGTKLTQQIEIHTDGQLQAVSFEKGGNATLISKEQNTWVAHASFNLEGTSVEVLKITSITVANATYVEFRRPKVEKGDYTDYKLSTSEFDKVTSEIKQTASGIQHTIESQNGKISQITQTVDGVVSQVSSNTQEIEGGDANLIESFEITPTLTNTGNAFERESNNINGWATFIGSSFANKTLNQVKFKEANGNVTKKEGMQYTLSFEVNTNCDIFGDNCYIKVTINDQQTQLTSQNVIKQSEEDDVAKPESKSMQYTFKYTFTPTADFIIPNIAIQTARKLKNEYNAYAHVSFRRFQIVEGTEVKGWGKQGGIKGEMSEIKQTIKGVQTTVSDNTGKITQLTVTADGLNSKVEDATGKVTQITQTVEGIQSTVSGQDNKISKITQTVNGVQAEVGQVNSQITRLTQTINGVQSTVSNQDGRITTLKQTVDGMKSTVQNNSGQISSVSQSVKGVLVKVDDNKQRIGQLAITSQNLQSDIRNLENNTNSKISQLSNNINLRVEKNKIINQINVSTEGILIDGKKIKITGETYIQNGIIKDAMIQSLKVDKITGNKASFVQAAFSDANSSTTINSRGILTKDRNNNTVGLNNGGLEMRDRSGNLVFKAVTRDWLDPNGYDDSAVLAALGRRQLTIGLAYNEYSEDNITPVISFKRREYDVGSSTRYYDSMYIEHQDRFRLVTTNYYRAQICDSRNAQNGNTYFSILSDSGKCGILWGDSQMYVKVEERCYSIKDILRKCNLL